MDEGKQKHSLFTWLTMFWRWFQPTNHWYEILCSSAPFILENQGTQQVYVSRREILNCKFFSASNFFRFGLLSSKQKMTAKCSCTEKGCFPAITVTRDTSLVRKVVSRKWFDVGEKFECRGFSPVKESKTILDAALAVDVASGTSTFVPIIVECASTRFSSTVNFVGFSTLQCTILHAVVFRNVALFQTFCAKLGDLDLEDRHCHYCGKNSETPLLRCAECRIAVYCNKNCQRKDWKEGPPISGRGGTRISHKRFHARLLEVADMSEWNGILEERRTKLWGKPRLRLLFFSRYSQSTPTNQLLSLTFSHFHSWRKSSSGKNSVGHSSGSENTIYSWQSNHYHRNPFREFLSLEQILCYISKRR